jgi:hypothetical protein
MIRRFTRVHAVASAVLAVVLAAGVVAVSREGAAAPPAGKVDRESVAKALLAHHYDRFGTQALTRALKTMAGEQPQSPGRQAEGGEPQPRAAGLAPAALPRAGLRNVRVNNPGADRFEVDQTTQSETSIAVAGRNVAVGFNDSQQALPIYTDGLDLTGYAYSNNGGRTFTDGGTLPNPENFTNLGDPWLASDRAGRMYFGTLTFGGDVGNLEVAVARSTNGGRTWSAPRFASPHDDNLFYVGDKDAVTTGRDPHVAGRDNVYAAWDDITFDFTTGNVVTGLAVATSTDHGLTFSLHYADKILSSPNSCSFAQYIGAQPLVDPSNGTLYVAAEKIAIDDPHCTGGQLAFSEVIFKSTDGGTTFGAGVRVSTVTPAQALVLGPGMVVRTADFPVLALRNGTLWMAWNDSGLGRDHIRLATSVNGGAAWTVRWATTGNLDEVQPALAADRNGLHLAYYHRNATDTLDTVAADSTDGGLHLTARAVTSRPFPGVVTVPQFDPQIAFGYMGDYISLVSDGAHLYYAWGDNRDRITNFTHPQGRNDPDVFFARR